MSPVNQVRDDCKKVREHLEQREFQQAIDLLKEIAAQKDFATAKYAQWATRELPRIRSIASAAEEAALDAVVVPELTSLEDDVLWQDDATDLSASAELRPRDRNLAVSNGKGKNKLILAGLIVAAAGVLIAALLILIL